MIAIGLPFARVGGTQADRTDRVVVNVDVDQNHQTFAQPSKGLHPLFAIVEAPVFADEGGCEIEPRSFSQRQTVLGQIGSVLRRIDDYIH